MSYRLLFLKSESSARRVQIPPRDSAQRSAASLSHTAAAAAAAAAVIELTTTLNVTSIHKQLLQKRNSFILSDVYLTSIFATVNITSTSILMCQQEVCLVCKLV